MDIIHENGAATATQVHERMVDPPTNAAVRSVLRILVEKGHLSFEQDGPRYVYSSTAPPDRARRSAMKHVLRTFFGGSVENAVAALLDLEESTLSEGDRDRIRALIEKAREEGG